MRFNYDKETDALYINFIDSPGIDSFEIYPEYIADIDSKGNLVGIEILNVKGKIDLSKIFFNQIPSSDIRFLNQPAAV